MTKPELPINILELMRQLPHRYPIILVDRVIDIEMGKKITALKNVTINEPYFMGHFPGYPVMPGVLIVEALAQTAGILGVLSFGAKKDNEVYFFAGIDKARFKRQVIPGDTLMLEVELIKTIRGLAKYKARALVGGVVAAEAELMTAKREV
ncbi:MAG: 3-hydroxyacyl-ACP dehydratase FabZ [Burkholderiales bacterium]|nr:3-hydroxyacyl-ACP dehydratase FabZ [Burkholderiales bacterium]